jgi:hypothetical protein
MKKLKTKLIVFYDKDVELLEYIDKRKDINCNELVKRLLKEYFGLMNDN